MVIKETQEELKLNLSWKVPEEVKLKGFIIYFEFDNNGTLIEANNTEG